jgi:outer membrane protein OmpA-like peptidoglycan-associated protein
MVERSDWSRYDNGKYVGHVYREVRASIVPSLTTRGEAFLYQGNFFVLEETLRDLRQSARGLNAVIPVSFEVHRNGGLRIEDDQGFPSLRGFPAFPPEAVGPGSKWTARGSRVVDPLNQGTPVVVPLVAEYEYRGIEVYRDIPVHRIAAKYASRYTGTAGGGQFHDLRGSHNVDILLRVADGLPLLIRDNLDETFAWPDGSTVRFRGFTLIFGEGTIPMNRETLISSLGATLGSSKNAAPAPQNPTPASPVVPLPAPPAAPPAPSSVPANPPNPPLPESIPGIDMKAVPEGVRLTIRDIRFVPDSEEFLPAERPRLDLIAQALRDIPGRTFLVEGHTAAVGLPAGEKELSVGRAKRMVDELVRRGIPADRFIYKGWGGEKPLGDNAGEEGRRLNRRVEITILE